MREDIRKWRRDLHQIPEIGLELPNTVAYVKSVLDECALDYQEYVNGNALTVVIKGTGEGKTIGLRADMDALPVEEETKLPFASVNGNMHACGHDGHMSMLLAAAKYFSNHRDEFKGTIKLLFQPGEEGHAGARNMINEGALDDPRPDAVFGLHCGRISATVPQGKIGFKKGKMMASSDVFTITVRGQGGHAAHPYETVDPIVMAAEIIQATQKIISREIRPYQEAVLTYGSVQAGRAMNIIPNEVVLQGTVRTMDQEVREFIAKRMKEIAESVAEASRGEAIVDYHFMYPPLINDDAFTQFAYDICNQIMPESGVLVTDTIMAAEDMAEFLTEVPGTFALLTNMKEVDGKTYPHHHPKFDIDEDDLVKGANLLIHVAIEYLNKEEAL